MSTHFREVEEHARGLSPKEKAALARKLIEELDGAVDVHVEQLWVSEAQRRDEAFLKGDVEALPGDEVMNRARKCL